MRQQKTSNELADMIATWLGMQVGFAFAAATKASTVLKPFAGGVTST